MLTDEQIDAICAPDRAKRWTGDGRAYDRATARLIEAALLRTIAAPAAAEPGERTEFCWLIELFLPHGGNSLGRYHTGFTDLHGNSRSTPDVYQARRYPTKEAAQAAATKLGHTLQGVWHAVEHGFASPPPQAREPRGRILAGYPALWVGVRALRDALDPADKRNVLPYAYREKQADDDVCVLLVDDGQAREPQWIPVGERMPTGGVKVLVIYRNNYGNLRRTCAHYSPKHTVDASTWDEGEPDETEDGTFEPEGWWEEPVEIERVEFIADEVTHWMPLPAPPVGGASGGEEG